MILSAVCMKGFSYIGLCLLVLVLEVICIACFFLLGIFKHKRLTLHLRFIVVLCVATTGL